MRKEPWSLNKKKNNLVFAINSTLKEGFMKIKGLVFLGLCGVFLLLLSSPSFSQIVPFYVLDGYGGVHAGGGAVAITPSTPYFGWDIAKSIEYVAVGFSTETYGDGYLVLDGYGGIHQGGKLYTIPLSKTPYWGWDIARSITARIIPPRADYITIHNSDNLEVTSTSYVAIQSLDLYLPDDGYVLLTGTCSLGNNGTAVSDARVALGVDTLTALDDIEAEIQIPDDINHGHSWQNLTRSQMTFCTPGLHTFYFLIKKVGTSGKVEYFDSHLNVIYIDQNYYGYSAKPVVRAESEGRNGSIIK
jgi:hypothetical protein